MTSSKEDYSSCMFCLLQDEFKNMMEMSLSIKEQEHKSRGWSDCLPKCEESLLRFVIKPPGFP